MDHERPLPFPPPLQPFAAPADLRPWIEGAVIVRAPAGLGRSCFPGRVSSQLVLRLSGTVRQVPPGDGAEAAAAPLLPAAALIGPSTQPSTFAHEGEVSAVGLILRPEAVAGWLGPIGAQLADHTTALDAVDGPSWNAVLDALQEARDDRERLTLLFDALRRRVQRHPRQEDARCRALQLQRPAPGAAAAAGRRPAAGRHSSPPGTGHAPAATPLCGHLRNGTEAVPAAAASARAAARRAA